MSLLDLDTAAREELSANVRREYDELKARGLNLDLTRGKPSSEQLDICVDVLSLPGDDFVDATGADVRNYGNLAGIKDIRAIWADVIGVPENNLYAGDSSSLNIMFDLMSWSCLFGNNDSPKPWLQDGPIKWICPVPGYDRHFAITEKLGFEMVEVPMLEDGPDADAIAELAKDPAVKGVWIVPMYSNPTGYTVSEEVVRKLCAMETAAPDFRIVWDNAYAIHTLTDEFPPIIDVLSLAEEAGNPNRFWVMSSTSKITQAGSGVAFFASSRENLEWYASIAGVRGIGPNKVNQLAHAKFFGDAEGVRAVMRKHAGSMRPKFDAVDEILESRLGEYDVARWTKPEGGYFVSLDVVDGTATRVWELAREAGITLTKAGSSYPHGKDANDRNIRLAPSLPPLEEVRTAMDGVATCVLLAALEKLG